MEQNVCKDTFVQKNVCMVNKHMKEMLNIISYLGNVNWNSEIKLHTHRMAKIKRPDTFRGWWGIRSNQKPELSYVADGNAKQYICFGKEFGSF